MIIELISWIDRSIKEIAQTTLFKEYFNGIETIEGEDCFYLTNKLKGIELVASKELIINTIHIFSENHEENKGFKEALPFSIKFSFNRNDIRGILGDPNKSGGGHRDLYLGFIPYWDKYYFETYSLHLSYSDNDNSINMISIGSLKLEEYFNSELQ